MLDLDAFWLRNVTPHGLAENRPDFRFDLDFYRKLNTDINWAEVDAASHFESHGRIEGRVATLYHSLRRNHKNLDNQIADILTEPELKAAIQSGQPDAAELAFELLSLPYNIDVLISDFSAQHYVTQYPDIKEAGVHPLTHFLLFGRKEKRIWLRTLRRNFHKGGRDFDPEKKTILLVVHEFTNTGAPVVALQLLQEATITHNVIVLSLQSGPLLEKFRRDAICVFVSTMPHEEADFVLSHLLPHVSYALLNSTDASPFIRMLVPRGIPFGVYTHEYTQYSLPLLKTIWPSLYADCQIFSSEQVRDSWRDLHRDLGFDTDRLSAIVPQAELKAGRVSASEHAAARARIEKALGITLGNRRLIYGAGSVHWRKGSDLFVMTAQIGNSIDPDSVWVWIGDGMNHEDFHSGVWQEKHMLEAGVNRTDGYFFHLPGGPYYKDLCNASDVMLLASRLDPLPNVILDAVKSDCDVVMFHNASGFDDPAYDQEPRFHRVDFGRVDLAAQAILNLHRKMERPKRYPIAKSEHDSAGLFNKIEAIIESTIEDQNTFFLGDGDYDLPVLFSERDADRLARRAEMQKVWNLGRRTVWKSVDEARVVLQSSTHPVHRNSVIEPYGTVEPVGLPPFSIHVHAYYTDDLQFDVTSYDHYRLAERIVVTTDTERKARLIDEIMDSIGLKAEVKLIENQGRDILPFMNVIADTTGDADEIWAHVHQKKSLQSTQGGDVWRNFLLRNLFGGKDQISNAVLHMADPEVGLVAPFDPFFVGWFASNRIMPIYQRLVKTPFPDHPLLFPVGNMFWAKRKVVDQMNSYFGLDFPWPNEPLANDGTVFHLIERLWPTATYEAGLRAVFVSKPDEKRR